MTGRQQSDDPVIAAAADFLLGRWRQIADSIAMAESERRILDLPS
jgi:hypothetical protein